MSDRLNVIAAKHINHGELGDRTFYWFLPKKFNDAEVGDIATVQTKVGFRDVKIIERVHWNITLGHEPKLKKVVKLKRAKPNTKEDQP
ncbi:DUF5839 family protein [Sporolactobacillus terrae]|uniref:DUF5839 family protein n=1 Tax=Sporolactobacillus terrae TaxID=269673 RepID=UPI001CC0A516|nr:DUF5839 family protein [Sporolactobacillus terrae]UAK18091.1 DUF5839 family protein [Sporolactobacillus terrae]